MVAQSRELLRGGREFGTNIPKAMGTHHHDVPAVGA